MIYVTGDCHSDFRRFGTRVFPEQKSMTKEDCCLIAGDFGGVWCAETDREIRSENHELDLLEGRNFTTLFIDGNHENHERLDAMPVREWPEI